jgi:hypothetical protein
VYLAQDELAFLSHMAHANTHPPHHAHHGTSPTGAATATGEGRGSPPPPTESHQVRTDFLVPPRLVVVPCGIVWSGRSSC